MNTPDQPAASSRAWLKWGLIGLIALLNGYAVVLMYARGETIFALLTLTLVVLVTFFIPLKKVCVRQGSPLYILPIAHSTVGTRIEAKSRLPVLYEYKDYLKVEYHHGITGWIKHEDLGQD